jgi:hypothetical protein
MEEIVFEGSAPSSDQLPPTDGGERSQGQRKRRRRREALAGQRKRQCTENRALPLGPRPRPLTLRNKRPRSGKT